MEIKANAGKQAEAENELKTRKQKSDFKIAVGGSAGTIALGLFISLSLYCYRKPLQRRRFQRFAFGRKRGEVTPCNGYLEPGAIQLPMTRETGARAPLPILRALLPPPPPIPSLPPPSTPSSTPPPPTPPSTRSTPTRSTPTTARIHEEYFEDSYISNLYAGRAAAAEAEAGAEAAAASPGGVSRESQYSFGSIPFTSSEEEEEEDEEEEQGEEQEEEVKNTGSRRFIPASKFKTISFIRLLL